MVIKIDGPVGEPFEHETPDGSSESFAGTTAEFCKWYEAEMLKIPEGQRSGTRVQLKATLRRTKREFPSVKPVGQTANDFVFPEGLSDREQNVLMVLLNGNGAFVSHATITQQTSYAVSMIQDAVKKLRSHSNLGANITTARNGNDSGYTLTLKA